MGRISDAQKESIRQRADIVAVIGERVALTKKGRDYWGCCPFHDEKTPSFLVNPQKQAWYCHGACKEGGDVFSFVAKTEALSFPDAMRFLARRFGVEVEDETPEQRARSQRKADLLYALNRTVDFYKRQLWEGKSESAAQARAFLERRGVREETAAAFSLGVAPQDNALGRSLQKKPQEARTMLPLLRELGLVRADGRDFFSNRLLFPIADESGRWAGFGGRRLNEQDDPKFLNTRESPLFSKKHLLYGLSFAREAKPRPTRLVVVEGYLDVVIAHQAGCSNVVAVCGLGFGREHALLAKRFVEGRVVLMFDGDAAGRTNNLRVLKEQLESDLDVRIAILPEKMDPDDFILKEGKDAFEKLVAEQSLDLFHYLVDVTIAKEGRVTPAVVSECAQLLGKFQDDIRHQLSLKHVAEKLGFPEDLLRKEALKAREAARKTTRGGPTAIADAAREQDVFENTHPHVREMLGVHACAGEPFEVSLLEALLAGEQPAPDAPLSADDFTAGPLRELARAALEAGTAENREQRVLDRLHDRGAALGVATRLLERVAKASAADGVAAKDYKSELEAGARALVARRSRARAEQLLAEIERANAKGDFDLVQRLLQEKTRLAREARGLEARAPGAREAR